MKLNHVLALAVVSMTAPTLAVAANAQAADKAATGTAVAQQAQPGGPSDRTTATTGAPQRPETRDWAKADANGDHLISPEEMEAYLKANPGPFSRSPGAAK